MAYRISTSERFEKQFKQLAQQEQKQIKNKIEILAVNPLHPSLRTKRIKGTDDMFECSINMDIRIIWHYEKNRMMLLSVGHHDILKKR